jgi:hypothetical protein
MHTTLTGTDRDVLAELVDRSADRAALARAVGVPVEDLADRLSFMADNGLVRETDGEYGLTDDGRRVLRAPGDGSADDAIDAPEAVVWALQARGLRADRLDAVLSAHAFLRYWGTATAAEIKDGVFSEVPLGFETAEEWWTEFVRAHLREVPDVEAPADEDGFWRFAGRPGVADLSEGGRRMLFGRGGGGRARHASAREAAAELELTDAERLAVGAALATLQRAQAGDREVDGGALRDAAGDVRAGGAEYDEGWLDGEFLDALGRLPGVVRSDGRWRYALGPDGYEQA